MISIIVPVYKVEKYLKKCIDSITAQEYRDLEIILVDDGSPDNCPAICDEYAQSDSRIKVIHKENGGLLSARKAGLEASTGEYVGFVDGDDWLEPDMYALIAESIDKYSADCVITQFYYSFPEKENPSRYMLSREYYTAEELRLEVFPTMLFNGEYYRFGIYPNCWSKVFRKEILEKHLPDTDSRIRLGEDIAFTYPCLMECKSVSFVDKPLYHYREDNPGSMTKAYDTQLVDIYMLPYLTIKQKSGEYGVDLSPQLPYYLLYLINFVIRNEANFNNPKSRQDSMQVLDAITGSDEVMSAVKQIDITLLPAHTRLLASALKIKSKPMLMGYIKLLRNFL